MDETTDEQINIEVAPQCQTNGGKVKDGQTNMSGGIGGDDDLKVGRDSTGECAAQWWTEGLQWGQREGLCADMRAFKVTGTFF